MRTSARLGVALLTTFSTLLLAGGPSSSQPRTKASLLAASTQLLGNPGFETGTATPWAATSGVLDNGTSEAAHGGSWKAWLCGYTSAHTDTLSQSVSLPTGSSASLSFWLHIDTSETGTSATANLQVQVKSSTGAVLKTLGTYTNLNAASGYAQQTFDLSSFAGQTIQIALTGTQTTTKQTSFVVDDFALTATSSGDTTAPTVSVSESGSTGSITFSATAADNAGGSGMSRVEFSVDGALKGTVSASPYTMTFDSTSLADGSHTLIAKAYDVAGNNASSSTSFTTSNGGTTTATKAIKVAIVNQSTVLTDAQIKAVLPAWQTQVSRDFAPAWGMDATLSFVPKGSQPPAGYWWVLIMDNSDVQGAGGYHDLTTDGLPIGKVFAADAISHGYNWSITGTHELLEMLGDPFINESVIIDKGSAGTAGENYEAYFHEMGDPVEADQFGYSINGTMVTDFILPAWFKMTDSNGNPVGSNKYDFMSKCTAPLQILTGGYMGTLSFTTKNQWGQSTSSGFTPGGDPDDHPHTGFHFHTVGQAVETTPARLCWHGQLRQRKFGRQEQFQKSVVTTISAKAHEAMAERRVIVK